MEFPFKVKVYTKYTHILYIVRSELSSFFENNNKKNARNGMTVSEIASTTNLTSEEVYEVMNHLDIKLNDYSEEERWFIMHTDTIPLLMLLTQGKEFFRI